MDQLIPITGYAETYEELCNKKAESGEFYNCLDVSPFMTYCQTGQSIIGATLHETDVIGWFQVKAELESNIRPQEGDVYITGLSSPYTRWKAEYIDYKLTWVEDGREEKKIVKHFKTETVLTRTKEQPEEGIFYSVGRELPFKVYGVVTQWEPVGTFVSYIVNDMKQLVNKPTKSNPGEVAFMKGIYYVFTGKGWKEITVVEPMSSVYMHTYEQGGTLYKLREGPRAGTLEFYAPKE